jgi:hypothetical protein
MWLRMVAHLIVDVQVVLQRVAASGGSSVVSDQRDIVGVGLARAGAAHDEVGRLVVMRFRFWHWTSVCRWQRKCRGCAHSMRFGLLSRIIFQAVKVDAAVTHALEIRSQVRDPTRTSLHEQMHGLRAGINGNLGDEMKIGFAFV